MFGPSIGSLKGNTVKPTSKMEREDKWYNIPLEILQEYKKVHFAMDMIHVNGIMFMLSCSKHIGLQ